MQKKAFTLIELLVVIAIIAILAAILFPVFAQAKLAAKKTTDLSNIKQIGTSIAIYQNDSDDLYFTPQDPCYNGGTTLTTCSQYLNGTNIGGNAVGLSNNYTVTSGGSLNYLFWFYKLYPYTKSYTIFQNPTNSEAFLGSSANGIKLISAKNGVSGYDWGGQDSYAYNAFYLSPVSSTGVYSPVSPSSVPRIAGTIAMVDGNFHVAGPDVTNASGLTVTSHLNTTSGTAEYNYITGGGTYTDYSNYWMNVAGSDYVYQNGSVTPAQAVVKGPTMFNAKPNVEFVDGHAKSLSYAQAIGDICYWSTDADATHTNCSN